jgi:transcriptional regulator with XRE-family HTH domain
MGRKARPAMRGLAALGGRLKQIRQQSGLSQMKLAKLIGFDPAHGYKYILRLEKGQVPNPTLRTVAAYLEACGTGWQAVVDELPSTGTVSASPLFPSARSPRLVPGSMTLGPRPQSPALTSLSRASSRRKDSRPLREQLRSRRLEQRELRTHRFWAGVKQAEEEIGALLDSLHLSSVRRRAYLAFARACCSTIDAFEAARPGTLERELVRLAQPATGQGLDQKVLVQIQSLCIRVFRSESNSG